MYIYANALITISLMAPICCCFSGGSGTQKRRNKDGPKRMEKNGRKTPGKKRRKGCSTVEKTAAYKKKR